MNQEILDDSLSSRTRDLDLAERLTVNELISAFSYLIVADPIDLSNQWEPEVRTVTCVFRASFLCF